MIVDIGLISGAPTPLCPSCSSGLMLLAPEFQSLLKRIPLSDSVSNVPCPIRLRALLPMFDEKQERPRKGLVVRV